MNDLGGAVAVVTGAASGIGLALTEACLERGAAVAMLDIEHDRLESEAGRLTAQGPAPVLPVVCDVSRPEAWDEAARAIGAALGDVDLLVSNAGVGPVGPRLWELTAADWEWTLGVNLWGAIHAIERFVPGMVARDRGHVVLISSAAGLLCPPSMGSYVTTKHALTALGESLLHELGRVGSAVGVTVVWPGLMATRMAENERNRPASLANPHGVQQAREHDFASTTAAMRSAVARGREPALLATEILDAVEAGRFGLIGERWIAEAFATRSDAIQSGESPPDPS